MPSGQVVLNMCIISKIDWNSWMLLWWVIATEISGMNYLLLGAGSYF